MSSEAVSSGDGGGRDEPRTASPRNNMKFLCSHGGRIFPRPVDGHLKYVGGDTRVVSVSRDVTFPDLMRKLTEIFPGDVVLKYQILSHDLDTLVSVRTDEDLKHMIDEYNSHKSEGAPKLRTFLFPAKPIVTESHLAITDANALEQSYIDAINGIIRTTVRKRRPTTNTNSPSPKSTSPDGHTVESVAHDAMLSNAPPVLALPKRYSMYKVHSSPSLYSLGNNNSQSPQNNNCNSNSNASSPRGNRYSSNQQSYYQNHQQQFQNAQAYQCPSQKGGLPPWMVPSDMSRLYVNEAPQKWNAAGGEYFDDSSHTPYSGTPEVRSRAQCPRQEWSGKGVE